MVLVKQKTTLLVYEAFSPRRFMVIRFLYVFTLLHTNVAEHMLIPEMQADFYKTEIYIVVFIGKTKFRRFLISFIKSRVSKGPEPSKNECDQKDLKF